MSVREKIDAPFETETAIVELVRLFESCELPYERWTHRTHLAVAASYLRHYPHPLAMERVRSRIPQYNSTRGDPNGYHETITVVYMRKVASVLNADTVLHEVVNTLAERCRISWLLQYYSESVLWSAEARATFIAPDRKPLDF